MTLDLPYYFPTYIHLADGDELICLSTAPNDIMLGGSQLDIIAQQCEDDRIFKGGFDAATI
jgi:hypothetical protein